MNKYRLGGSYLSYLRYTDDILLVAKNNANNYKIK